MGAGLVKSSRMSDPTPTLRALSLQDKHAQQPQAQQQLQQQPQQQVAQQLSAQQAGRQIPASQHVLTTASQPLHHTSVQEQVQVQMRQPQQAQPPQLTQTSRTGSRVLSKPPSLHSIDVVVSTSDPLEHISDREAPDDRRKETKILESALMTSSVASLSPGMRRLSRDGSRSPLRQASQKSLLGGSDGLHNAKKFNSTSTLFVDSTVSQPNMQETLECVALSLRYMILEGHRMASPMVYANVFDEKAFPLTDEPVSRHYARDIPADSEICHFISAIFEAAALPVECAIVTLVYISRVRAQTGLCLHASNWKRVLLGAILMASKVWDDQAVWNVDFCSMLPAISVDDMNDLERTYLEMLQFNINVESSIYTKFYFDLRSLAEENNKAFPLDPLTRDQAEKIEALSNRSQVHVKQNSLRHAKSLDLQAAGASPAIIS
eukprot:m.149962 g.149962  ORF g.149962 m.149962 type:complete len:435 (+) comp52787_c0_seq1:83-1387(+)